MPAQYKQYEILKTVHGNFMVLINGVQWGRGPRDLSGASSQTWRTKREAKEAIEAALTSERN